jgi:glutamine synthetase
VLPRLLGAQPLGSKKIPTVCGSLREALMNLDKDRDFLKTAGVFDDDFIDSSFEDALAMIAEKTAMRVQVRLPGR